MKNLGPDSKVLVVDDFETVRAFIHRALKDLKMTHYSDASDGREAMKLLKEAAAQGQPFDLVLCDRNMPHMNGLEVLEAMRQDPLLNQIAFIMVTAESEITAVSEAFYGGATEYIVKPFSVNTLRSKLQSLQERLRKAG
jgi:two-component system chemotaxis response regulator CheY